jgi:hypothetical protein
MGIEERILTDDELNKDLNKHVESAAKVFRHSFDILWDNGGDGNWELDAPPYYRGLCLICGSDSLEFMPRNLRVLKRIHVVITESGVDEYGPVLGTVTFMRLGPDGSSGSAQRLLVDVADDNSQYVWEEFAVSSIFEDLLDHIKLETGQVAKAHFTAREVMKGHGLKKPVHTHVIQRRKVTIEIAAKVRLMPAGPPETEMSDRLVAAAQRLITDLNTQRVDIVNSSVATEFIGWESGAVVSAPNRRRVDGVCSTDRLINEPKKS